jgi:cytochrome c-type biogenesis protein CcmH/NrfF
MRGRTLALMLLLAAVAASAASTPHAARAQTPERSEEELAAQQLAIEQQLLCPQCTNKRLDVCELPICDDMRETIRRELAAGRPPDDIVLFFKNRYGERVLADLPKSGFNLLLWGWVGASLLLVTAGGALGLYRLRRASTPVRTGDR